MLYQAISKILSSESNYKHSNRQTYSISSPLKEIQGNILKKILAKVNYPSYLFGGIKGTDYIKDAALHLNCKHLIKEDIFHFFDYINGNHIYNIWNGFFKFPHLVSETLTRLTIYENKLPQGAQTSTYLSNLVFWKSEPKLAYDFAEKGFYIFSIY